MNILFHIDVECVPENGGIERVTSLLTPELRRRSHKVFSSYTIPVGREAFRPDFDGVFHLRRLDVESFAQILKDEEIDIVIVQKVFRDLPWTREAITRSGRNVKMIYCLHSCPHPMKGKDGFKALVFNDKSKHSWIKIPLKILMHPIRAREYDHQQYTWPGRFADTTVLLSEKYVNAWKELSGDIAHERIRAIPNPLTFDTSINIEDLNVKDKRVLIVARLEERQKNLTEALHIWNEIEKDPDLNEWRLDIVGDGPDRKKIEELSSRLNLKRVKFHGYQNPQKYFRSSSIFMMTSRFEGWPMTINESCQNGCVPVIYDSFPAVKEVVNDNGNGFIVKNHDIPGYIDRLKTLMQDKELRIGLAKRGIEESERFTVEKIVDRWEDLFKDITNGGDKD